MPERSEKNIHQELIIAVLKSGMAFTTPGGVHGGETEQAYLTRLAVAVSQLSDASWILIPEWAQAWYNEAAKTMNSWYDEAGNQLPARRPLAACQGIPQDAFMLGRQPSVLPAEPTEDVVKPSQQATVMPQIPKTAQEDAEIALKDQPGLPEEQVSAYQMAESTSEAGKPILRAPAVPAGRQAPRRLHILDALHAVIAVYLSEGIPEPTAETLREYLVRHGYRKLSMKLIRKECKSFARTVEGLRDAGMMKK